MSQIFLQGLFQKKIRVFLLKIIQGFIWKFSTVIPAQIYFRKCFMGCDRNSFTNFSKNSSAFFFFFEFLLEINNSRVIASRQSFINISIDSSRNVPREIYRKSSTNCFQNFCEDFFEIFHGFHFKRLRN